jgi:hypothetical protein
MSDSGFPLDTPFILALPIGDAAALLGISSNTINSWRNRDLLPEFGEFRGETKARLYRFSEILALAVMRDLTTGPAGIGASTAAEIAIQCVEILLADVADGVRRGMTLVVEAGGGQWLTKAVPYDGLAEYIVCWRRENQRSKRSRLEIIDLERIAFRVSAKLARYENAGLEKRYSEEEAMTLLEPFQEARMAEYLKKEIEKRKRIEPEVTEQAA